MKNFHFRAFGHFEPKNSRVDSILKCFNPRLLFQARVICPYKILKFEAKRYSFGGKLDEKLSFSDFQPLFDPIKFWVNSILKFSTPSSYRHPSASVKPPSVTPEMTPPQFRKFRTDWTVYRTITCIPSADQTAHLYSACDSVVQNSVINERPDFIQLRESEALDFLETIVTTRSNPAIHRMKFNSLKQGEHELIQDFMVRLRSASTDCIFECPNCQFNLSESHLRDQFIRGLCNTVLQADILTKASQLPSLTDVVNYALSVESALRDQAVLEHSTTPDPATVYAASQNRHKSQRNNRFKQPCLGCGSKEHRTHEREKKCPAWGKDCTYCGTSNHLEQFCLKKKRGETFSIDSIQLVAHVQSTTRCDISIFLFSNLDYVCSYAHSSIPL